MVIQLVFNTFSFAFVHYYFLKLIEPNWDIIFEESAYPANSEGITLDSSTAVHGLHIQSAGARVTN